jgi:hypothetical protein
MVAKSGVALAMAYFGKLSHQPLWAELEGRTGPQGIKDFKDDWDRLSEEAKAQLTAGLSDGTLTY